MGLNKRLIPTFGEGETGLADTGLFGTQVGHWGFEQNLNDSEGNYNFTASGTIFYSTAAYEGDYSLGFNFDSHISANGDGIKGLMNATYTGWAKSFWIRANYSSGMSIFTNRSLGIAIESSNWTNDNYLRRYSGGNWSNFHNFSLNGKYQDYFFVLNYDGTTLSLYVNNVLKVSTTSGFSRQDFNWDINRNVNGTNRNPENRIDDLRVFNAPLTSDQRTELYEAYP